MICACGLLADGTFRFFVERAQINKKPITVINTREAALASWRFDVGGSSSARVELQDQRISLDPEWSFFCRAIDTANAEANEEIGGKIRAFHNALHSWFESVPSIVANRRFAGCHNGSKPLHEAILREHGLKVPDSLTTSDIGEIAYFLRGGRSISKTICGVRATAMEVTINDFKRFEPSAGPVHLQRLIVGADVEVHVVGDQVVAQKVETSVVDYRDTSDLFNCVECCIDQSIRSKIIAATRCFGLVVAGWDFKVDHRGQYWALEANPMPGFGLYDKQCDGKISDLILRQLS